MTFPIRDARRLYGIDSWGNGYFGVSATGHLTIHPGRSAHRVDVHDLLQTLKRRKLRLPVLLRFPQILEDRAKQIAEAFEAAFAEFDYDAGYQGVFPIKVNQHGDVVNALARAGKTHKLGLEAGSKAELLIALTHDLAPDALIVCNGYKDAYYIELALRAQALGRRVLLIVEKPQELPRILRVAKKLNTTPKLGIRVRLHAKSSGKWEGSSGSAAKFGLTTSELLDCVRVLKSAKLLDTFEMLHFHVGSQITEIRRIKNAVREAARVYAKLNSDGCALRYLDVGGGLGVDYDGSNSSYEASINYTIPEYANGVVYAVKEICDAEGVAVPTLVSESGRALTAYHALLVTDVRGRNVSPPHQDMTLCEDSHDAVRELTEILDGLTRKNHREYFHDAEEMRDQVERLFDLGYLSLRDRAHCEQLIREIGLAAFAYAKSERVLPEEFQRVKRRLVAKYIVNFSVFQSAPDSWALDQLFPILPIHRLNERPTVAATLCDVTCDSDGEIDRFVDVRDVSESLPLHPLTPGKPYYVAICLLGAYQDVLGDYHNLFGRVDEAHVKINKNGAARVTKTIAGDRNRDVLGLFGHDPDAMMTRIKERASHLPTAEAGKLIEHASKVLSQYTYLGRD